MGLLNKIFKKKNFTEKQFKDSTNLVLLARGLAVSSYMPLLELHPEFQVIMESGQIEKWDFLLTVVGVGIAFSRLTSSVKEEQISGYSFAIRQALEDWDKNSSSCLVEFSNYLIYLFKNDAIEDFEKFKESVGAWLFFKLGEDSKSNNEIKQLNNRQDLFAIVGHPFCVTFGNYWEEIGAS